MKKRISMSLSDFQRKYGLKNETMRFYAKMEILEIVKDTVFFDKNILDNTILDKNTVYRYCLSANWQEDLDFYKKFVESTGKVKIFNKKEIKKLNKKRK